MSLIRWNNANEILGEFARMQREMQRLFQTVERPRSYASAQASTGTLFPPLNLLVADDRYVVECELPGFTMSNIELSITGDTLHIKGEKKEPKLENASYHRRERLYGTFNRSLTMPELVDAEKTTARFNNGVLTIELPKSEAVKPRQIQVKAG